MNKGFTLIELMIILSIIGIIAAIAIPQFVEYREDMCQKEENKQEKVCQDMKTRNNIQAIKSNL